MNVCMRKYICGGVVVCVVHNTNEGLDAVVVKENE